MSLKGEQTKQVIREKAYQLFAEKGCKEVTMKDICELTGLSRGGLYRHYESTEQIFLEIVNAFTDKQKCELSKKYDIKTGEAIVTAKQKCLGLVVIPPDYGLYVSASRAFIEKLRQYTDQVIQYSIDEAWAVFDGYEKLYGQGQMVSFAYGLKNEIKEELGFTVNVGVSTNFLLSKMAGDFSKPDKVHTLFPEEIEKKMWQLPVSELFFVGKATTAKLHKLGIYTIGELAQADEDMIRAHLKTPGKIIQGYARGEDLQPYMFTHEANKGYGNSLTAPVDVVTEEYAKHLILSLCETVGMRLRGDNVKICVVSVHTSKVESDAGRQYNLFDLQKYDRLETLNRTVDKIRERYGEDSIFRAGFFKSNVSHMGGGLDKERRSGVTIGIDVKNEKVRNL